MTGLLEVRFPHRTATAARVEVTDQVPDALRSLGFVEARPVLVLVGGAGGIERRERDRLRPLFRHALLPAIASVTGTVVDGGTDSGVMRMMGDALRGSGGRSPLVGVAAEGTVALPPAPVVEGVSALEPNHTHFVLVPGRSWGDESEWLALVAGVLAGPQPSVTVLVNGGETAWRDVEASVAARRPVIVVDHSGRAADDIASALRGAPGDRGSLLLESGLVQALPLDAGTDAIAAVVRALLESTGPSPS